MLVSIMQRGGSLEAASPPIICSHEEQEPGISHVPTGSLESSVAPSAAINQTLHSLSTWKTTDRERKKGPVEQFNKRSGLMKQEVQKNSTEGGKEQQEGLDIMPKCTGYM